MPTVAPPPSLPQRDAPPGSALADWVRVLLAGASAANARAPLLTVGPLLPLIAGDLGLSATLAGLLTALPLLLMGLLSIPAGLVSDRVGPVPVLVATQLGIALAGGARGLATTEAQLLGVTAVLGLAVGTSQPALAQVAGSARRVGPALASGIYSNGFLVGALAAFALTVPLLLPAAGGSWRTVLMWWGIPGLVLAGAWLAAGRRGVPPHTVPVGPRVTLVEVLRLPGFALMAGLYGGQSFIFYAVVSWLTVIYVARGWTLEQAAIPLVTVEVAATIAGVGTAALGTREGGPRQALLLGAVSTALGVAGLLLAPTGAALLWAALIGAGVSAIMLVTLAAPPALAPAGRVGAASGVLLALGLLGSMLGPFLVGALRDATGGFAAGQWLLVLVAVAMGLGALRVPPSFGSRGHARTHSPR